MAETLAPFTIARRWNDFLECPSVTARSTAFARAKSLQRIAQKKLVSKRKILVLNYPRNINRESISVWEFLATDVERVEGICAVGAVLEEVFF